MQPKESSLEGPIALFTDATIRESESSIRFFPLRFLGMALLIAWLCCTHVQEIYPGNDLFLDARNTFDLGMRFGDIGTFVILAVFASKIGSLDRHLKAGTALVVTTCIGTVVIALVLFPIRTDDVILTVTSIATAAGGAFLFCLWAQVYSRMGSTQTIIYGSISCIAAMLIAFSISIVEQPYDIILTGLLPLASLACAKLSLGITSSEPYFQEGVRYPVPWKLVVLMTLAGFLSGIAGFLLPNGIGGATHRIWATGIAGITILFMVYLRKERCDVRFLALVALPIAVASFALVPFAGSQWGFIVSFLGKLAYVWFTFFVLLALANIARRYDVPSLRLFALARACSEMAILIGVVLRRSTYSRGLHSDPLFLVSATAAGIIMLLICIIIWMSEKSVNADWGASGMNIETKTHVMGPRERYLIKCEMLGKRYGLTERETEILGLVGQRKSRAEIEQELFLSENTVKTHIRHVYQKLDIHSKTDVYRLLEV